jgi:hypothetical protein
MKLSRLTGSARTFNGFGAACALSCATFVLGAGTGTALAQATPQPDPATLTFETPVPSIDTTANPPQSAWVPNPPEQAPAGNGDIALAPSLLTSFNAADFADNIALSGGFAYIPPDPIAAAGLNHVVNVVNKIIEWYTKAGGLQNQQTLQAFFTAHGTTPVNATFDPKVVYDHFADRFVVVALEVQDTAAGDPVNSSRILVAVSDDGDPNGTWYTTAINSKLFISGADRWADYPGLELDQDVVYVTTNMYGFGGGSYAGVRLWIIRKGLGSGGFYDGGAATVTVHNPYAGAGVAITTMPALIYGAPGGTIGTWLVSYSGLTGGGNVYVQTIQVNDPTGTGGGPFFVNQQFIPYGTVAGTDNTSFAVPNAPQSGSGIGIETNDRRALDAVWRHSKLYMVTTIRPPSGPDAGEATARWFQLSTTTPASLTILDQGNVSGDDIAADTHTFFPAVAVNTDDDVAIGFAASAASIYAGAYYTCRSASDPAGTVQPSATLAAGVDYYVRRFGSGFNRWGDYSGISVDPADDKTFWVYNEYAGPRGFLDSFGEDGFWATRYGSFKKSACNTPPQDSDGDGDVDLTDYGAFLSCYNGPTNPYADDPTICICFDSDPTGAPDGDVDLSDYGDFLTCYNGPANPPNC